MNCWLYKTILHETGKMCLHYKGSDTGFIVVAHIRSRAVSLAPYLWVFTQTVRKMKCLNGTTLCGGRVTIYHQHSFPFIYNSLSYCSPPSIFPSLCIYQICSTITRNVVGSKYESVLQKKIQKYNRPINIYQCSSCSSHAKRDIWYP